MSQLSAKLRGSFEEPGHWCPGCEEMHVLPWKRGGWTFDGNVDAPTFTPSFRHSYKAELSEQVCHYILTTGVLNFCGDCTHDLAGKSVPLPDLPIELQDEPLSDPQPKQGSDR